MVERDLSSARNCLPTYRFACIRRSLANVIVSATWLLACGGVEQRECSCEQAHACPAVAGATFGAGTGGSASDGGGIAGTGGNAGTAGTVAVAGAAGTNATNTRCFDFTSGAEGWRKYHSQVWQLDDNTVLDSAGSDQLLVNTAVDWVDGPGYGWVSLGYVRLSIPFFAEQSKAQRFEYTYVPNLPITNLAGKSITAMVKLVSGLASDNPWHPAVARLFVKSGADYFYADGGECHLSESDWVLVSVDLNAPYLDENLDPILFDVSDIRELGVAVETPSTRWTVETPGVVLIDHVCISDSAD
jgi:hypothetical protein